MKDLKTTDCWIEVNANLIAEACFKVTSTNERVIGQIYVEKKTGVYVLTPEEFRKAIGDAVDYASGYDITQHTKEHTEFKTDYINNLLNKAL